ncbi:MAG: hypothetical protein Q8R00_04305 [Candidatus Nanoarchaeia archaeon]|nr:hypothetical protein [Candidatus Nanoarchaeia archaeon]
MADRNNLVLTVVLVAAALLFFNGGLTGNAVSSYYERSSGTQGTFCIYNAVNGYDASGNQVVIDNCTPRDEVCVASKKSTTSPSEAECKGKYITMVG